mmetsp:Transcript_25154/g.45317  ORF Transcript_25154/g.45317 Transcript_25154/m.45317 type:complete len:80 (-) Transcript_25154:244-483(-)
MISLPPVPPTGPPAPFMDAATPATATPPPSLMFVVIDPFISPDAIPVTDMFSASEHSLTNYLWGEAGLTVLVKQRWSRG